MSMRARGEGCIYKKQRASWEGRITVGHKDNGKPLFKYVTGKTQKEVLRKLEKLKDDFRNVELTADSQMKLSDWFDRWLENYMTGSVKEGTVDGYRSIIDNYITPYLGDKPLHQITRYDVQKLYHQLKHDGRVNEHPEYGYTLSDTMVRKIHSVFHRAMDTAVGARLIAYNPTRNTTVPKVNYKPMQVLNEDQLDIFIEALDKYPHWSDFFFTAITTGMRLGEITALQWDAFDNWKGTLKVSKTLKFRHGGSYYLERPKTQASCRTLFLPPTTAQIIRMRKDDALTEWIFPNPLCPEKPIHPHAALRALRTILEETNLPPIRFHDLRHTFATHAIASGVDAKTLAGILGHTNASFTLDTYTHVTTNMQYQAAKHVESFLGKILGEELLSRVEEEKVEKELSGREKTDVGKVV